MEPTGVYCLIIYYITGMLVYRKWKIWKCHTEHTIEGEFDPMWQVKMIFWPMWLPCWGINKLVKIAN